MSAGLESAVLPLDERRIEIGAECQNRTDDLYLEGRCFTIKLIPQK